MFDLGVWGFLKKFIFSFSALSFSFDFCSVAPDCSCSKMLVQMPKQSSQRVKPYRSRNNFLVSLQSWHLPVFVPMMKIFLGQAADLLFFAACISSHLYGLVGSVLLGVMQKWCSERLLQNFCSFLHHAIFLVLYVYLFRTLKGKFVVSRWLPFSPLADKRCLFVTTAYI